MKDIDPIPLDFLVIPLNDELTPFPSIRMLLDLSSRFRKGNQGDFVTWHNQQIQTIAQFIYSKEALAVFSAMRGMCKVANYEFRQYLVDVFTYSYHCNLFGQNLISNNRRRKEQIPYAISLLENPPDVAIEADISAHYTENEKAIYQLLREQFPMFALSCDRLNLFIEQLSLHAECGGYEAVKGFIESLSKLKIQSGSVVVRTAVCPYCKGFHEFPLGGRQNRFKPHCGGKRCKKKHASISRSRQRALLDGGIELFNPGKRGYCLELGCGCQRVLDLELQICRQCFRKRG